MKELLLLFILILFFNGCVEQPILLLKQDLNVSDLNVFSDLDGGFANSIYLPSQHVDGGGA
jgi:hypothetical protein